MASLPCPQPTGVPHRLPSLGLLQHPEKGSAQDQRSFWKLGSVTCLCAEQLPRPTHLHAVGKSTQPLDGRRHKALLAVVIRRRKVSVCRAL